ncbi:molybdopterin-dependent oxidoreductase [Anaerobacillus sp. CMMVII]|uniref:molybdopterin-dependent oxidoreductase n=1 Tax=Anaerobacillus sp. CMMVII TaxID=2755588 RepID=UPI0021B820CC|nr:molybdopterin-dependent oxidoreductase [Anaerobacillus sp. CMMVII]MCT8137787.1 molybdopterin-dependent oxidoreductase [Anaerobacillus sp. CMMVII]
MKWLRTIHLIHGILFTLMLLSGLFLYGTTTRTWFNQIGFPMVQFHIAIAFLYCGVILLSMYRVGRYLLKKPPIKKFNFIWMIVFFFLWTVSGLLMYFQAAVPTGIRNGAVVVHDWSTFLFIPWLLTHTICHLFKISLPWPNWWNSQAVLPSRIKENILDRRDFLKLLSFSFLFLVIGGWLKWNLPILTVAENEVKRRGYFRIYNVTNDFPRYPNNEWKLTIGGLSNKKVEIGYFDLFRLPSTTIVDDFHCVTGWSVRNVEMKGILLKDLFSAYGIEANSEFVTAYSGDNVYFDSFLTRQLLDEPSYLIYEIDGEPLKAVQGYPCRLYHPDMYGYKSVKWVDRLEFTESRKLGFWQQSGGYDLDGYL